MNIDTFIAMQPKLQSRIKRRSNLIRTLEKFKLDADNKEDYIQLKKGIAKLTEEQILDKNLMNIYIGFGTILRSGGNATIQYEYEFV